MPAEAPALHAVGSRAAAGAPVRLSAVLLASAGLLPAVWKVVVVPLPVVSLTLGRLLLLATAVLLAAECVRDRSSLPRPTAPAVTLAAGLTACFAWILLSAQLWGCRCSDEAAGFAEVAALTVLALAVATLEPRARPWLLAAAMAGAAVTAALAVAGVGPLTAGARVAGSGGDRLAGPLGNPNYLAFAVTLPLPALLVYQAMFRGRLRLLVLAATAFVAVAAVLTYSRGALLGTAVGALAAAALSASSRRGRLVAAGAVAATVVAGAIGYGTLLSLRTEPPPASRALAALDRSGWDARPGQGLIPRGPAQLGNGAGTLRVSAGPLEGASFPWGAARPGQRYRLTFEVRGGGRVGYALQDNLIGAGAAAGAVDATGSWRQVRLRWRPTEPAPNAKAYFWAIAPGTFELRAIEVADVRRGTTIAIPTALRGSVAAALRAREIAAEDRLDVGSRKAGVRLALRAFASSPLTGIGWGDFPAYADARAHYGRLPTHDEYLRVLAELGIVGSLLFAVVAAAIVAGLLRGRLDMTGLATLGVVVAGAVQLLFINGLVASQIAVALAFAVAVCCARAGRGDDETSVLWPRPEPPPDGVLWPR